MQIGSHPQHLINPFKAVARQAFAFIYPFPPIFLISFTPKIIWKFENLKIGEKKKQAGSFYLLNHSAALFSIKMDMLSLKACTSSLLLITMLAHVCCQAFSHSQMQCPSTQSESHQVRSHTPQVAAMFLPFTPSRQLLLGCWAVCLLAELNQLTKPAAKAASQWFSELMSWWVRRQTWHKGGEGNTHLQAEDGRIEDDFLQGSKHSQGASPSAAIKPLYQMGIIRQMIRNTKGNLITANLR